MRKLIIGALATAAFGTLGMAGASAGPLTFDSNARNVVTGANVQTVQFGGPVLVQRRWAGPRRYYRPGYRYYRRSIGPGVAGLAAGAIIGGAIAGAARPNYYYDGGVVDGDSVAYCMNRFKSYDPSSGTYLGYDGMRHPCP